MAKKKKENNLASKLVKEYDEADSLLDSRITDKKYGFNTYDNIFQTYLDPTKWPYSVRLPSPRGFTAIYNKSTRMVGGRFTGRVEGFELSDEVGAKIGTEHFKWSVERFNQHSDRPIEAIIHMGDLNTRLYGLGAWRVYWKIEYKDIKNVKTGKIERKKIYDNWWVETGNNRDLLFQPGRETINQSNYVIWRRYVSLDELERVQEDGAGFDEGAMAELREAKEGLGRTNTPRVSDIKNLEWQDNRFEVCITYYKDKWITWCPKQGTSGKKEALILRKMKNPYRHQEIPIVPLIYIPNQEDIYGMSEYQPVAALLKILSALQSQFIEQQNLDMYAPVLASSTETRIDTFKYRAKAVWLVNNMANLPQKLQTGTSKTYNFMETYRMIVTEFLEAMGETGSSVSQADQFGGKKTATEINDRAFIRGSRDSFNKLMLNAALKRLMYLIFEMLRDPKFTSVNTVIKVVGQEALEYFQNKGFGDVAPNEAGMEMVAEHAQKLGQNQTLAPALQQTGTNPFDLAYMDLAESGSLNDFAEPIQPVTTTEGIMPKLQINEEGDTGYLSVNPEDDYLGEFNFIPDIEALQTPDPTRDYQARAAWYQQASDAEKSGALVNDGYQLKHKDILTKLGELINIKEAGQYFKPAEPAEGGVGGIDQTGTGTQGVGPGGPGVPQVQAVSSNAGAPQPTARGGVSGPR
jgi:hypothetical protein